MLGIHSWIKMLDETINDKLYYRKCCMYCMKKMYSQFDNGNFHKGIWKNKIEQ